jgi:hypothetical protein
MGGLNMIYEIKNIRRFSPKPKERFYADLIDETGDLIISATLEYILNAIVERNLTLKGE